MGIREECGDVGTDYFSTYGIVQLFTLAEGWRQIFSVLGGGVIAGVAVGRLTALAPFRDGTAGTA